MNSAIFVAFSANDSSPTKSTNELSNSLMIEFGSHLGVGEEDALGTKPELGGVSILGRGHETILRFCLYGHVASWPGIYISSGPVSAADFLSLLPISHVSTWYFEESGDDGPTQGVLTGREEDRGGFRAARVRTEAGDSARSISGRSGCLCDKRGSGSFAMSRRKKSGIRCGASRMFN